MAAKRGKKKGRRKGKHHTPISKARGRTKADLSRSRGHKPVALLESWANKMGSHEKKLRGLIAKRKAAGE
jgi:hypothetical protein